MALDVGTKRIGIAISDFLHVIANGYSYIQRQPEKDAIKSILNIAKDNNVEEIVVGVPVNMDGTKGAQAQDCTNFADKIKNIKVVFEDERLTSYSAEQNLRDRKINFQKEKGLVDVESARLILEQYLSRL